jgi:hypothetical protein
MIYARRIPFKPDGTYLYSSNNFAWWHVTTTKNDAIRWVRKNGPRLVKALLDHDCEDVERSMHIKMVSSFEDFDEDECEEYFYDNILDNSAIYGNRQTSFAFSQETYKLLLDEHYEAVKQDVTDLPASHIVYIDANGAVVDGGTDKPHFERCNALYFEKNRAINLADFEKYCATEKYMG